MGDRLGPLPPDAWEPTPMTTWIVRVAIALPAIAVLFFVFESLLEWDRVRTAPPPPTVRVPELPALPEPEPEPEVEVVVDLDGAIARMANPPGWAPIMAGVFMRPSSAGEFLTDMLLVQADCFGGCDELDANMRAPQKHWRENRIGYRIHWTIAIGELRRPAPDRVAFDAELRSEVEGRPSARVRVVVVRPPGAEQALLCEVFTYGDLDEAAAACDAVAFAKSESSDHHPER